MRERPWSRNALVAILVALVMVLSTAASLVAFLPQAPAASAGAPAGPTGLLSAPKASGPLTSVPGSASNLNPSNPTPLGTTTVVPVPAKYNAKAPDSVTVTLRPSASLTALVNNLNNPASPEYRQFLTASTLGSEYGNSAYPSAVSYFEGFGLSVQTSSTDLTLTVTGTVGQISAAFHTGMDAYQAQYQSAGSWNPTFGNASGVAGTTESGPVFYANSAPAQLPAGLAYAVNGIAGLDGMAAQPNVAMPLNMYPGYIPAQPATPGNLTNTTVPSSAQTCAFGVFGSCNSVLDTIQADSAGNFLWTNFSPLGFTCSFDGLCGNYQFLFPSTMPAISGAHNLWFGNTTIASEPDQGQGITIAVVEVGCGLPSDFAAWSAQAFGSSSQLMNRLTQIAVNTPFAFFPNNNLNNCILNGEFAGWTLETELDVEYAAAMAPGAHIDVIGIPYPGYFSSFDQAYGDIAQYLSLGSTGGVCPTSSVLNTAGLYVVEGAASGGACSVTITSNSYGSGEEYAYFDGSPMYITVEDQELELLNSVGVTNFFASGDGGGVYAEVNDFMPADSPGATSVGGAQVTAESGSSEFPVTSNSFTYCDGFSFFGFCFGAIGTAYWAEGSGIGGTAYWSYGFGLGGTYRGITGGGFGQSLTETQPWWQNALDTYSTAAKIDPVISGSAAFNMTVYAFGTWNLFYGGTSFATPTTAGEWALIEEQANVAFGNPKMGDINPLLYAAHNAYEAGAGGVSTNPYLPMQAVSNSFDSYPANSFTWYYYNLSIETPSAPVQPLWFPSLGNPAGSGWNYLQGLGIPLVDLLDQALVGQSGLPGHTLMNPAFSLLVKTSSGWMPFNTLTAGSTYTLKVLDQSGQGGIYNVEAYSGQASGGMYGGGTITTLQTGSAGTFSYTPTSGESPGGDAATTYGYFLVTSLVGGSNAQWAFDSYAVAQPTPTGTLTLCVVDPYGNCQTSVAETTTFTTTTVGFYNLFGHSQVYLNGMPVSGAVVSQVAVQSQYGLLDPTLPPASYAPGVTIGQTISDTRGEAVYWIDGFTAENNGPLFTDVYQLTATYDGMVSNTVTVFEEPQSGSFYTQNLALDATSSGGAVVGDLSFAGMKYVDFVNVSIGSSPGQYVNYTCGLPGAFLGGAPTFYGFAQPPNTQMLPGCSPYYDTAAPTTYEYPLGVINPGIWESGVTNGTLPVNLSTAGLTGPIVVSEVAGGTNDVSFSYSFCFFGFCFSFAIPHVEYPMYWQDPTVFLPASLSSSAGSQTVTGADTFTFAGTSYPGATGTLTLVWGGGTEVLANGISGSYTLNTATLMDGSYSVVFTEQAPGAATTTRTVSFYADNEAASLSQLVNTLNGEVASDQATISADQATIGSLNTQVSSLQGQVSTLQGELSTANANLAQLQSQVSSLQGQVTSLTGTVATLKGQVSTLTGELANANAAVSSLDAQIANLEAQLATSQGNTTAEQAQLAALQAQLGAAQQTIQQDQATISSDQGTISTDTASIATLNAQVTQLQNELSSKKGTVAPLWFNSIGSLGVIAIIALVGAVGGVTAYVGGRRANRKTGTANPPPSDPTSPTPRGPANATPETVTDTSAGGRKAALDDAMAEAFRRSLVTTLQASVATQKALLSQGRVEDAMRLNARAREVAQEALTYCR